jgi:catalase
MTSARIVPVLKVLLLLATVWLCIRHVILIPVVLLGIALWHLCRRFRFVRIALLTFVVVSVGWLSYKSSALPLKGPQGEFIAKDEDVWTSEIMANGVSIVNANRTNGVYHRDGHPKTIGCAKATFTVNQLNDVKLDQPVFLQQGVFAKPREFKAWVRFSGGSPQIQGDWKPDARGVAIKLLGVEGDKILPGLEKLRTQDFLMINHPTFFIGSVADYVALTRLQVKSFQQNKPLLTFRYFFQDASGSVWHPSAWRLREMREAVGLLSWPPSNVLADQFYSMSAYALGSSNYVKYSLRPAPCSPGQGTASSRIWSLRSDALRQRLQSDLKQSKSCFDFMVQPQNPTSNMPVEDTTIEWQEKDSPFIPVAKLEIAKQDIDPYTRSGFCENLSNTPWHSLPEHRPVGGLNRVRRFVYESISNYRHCMNKTAMGEPPDDGSPILPGEACEATQPVSMMR